MTVTLYHAPHTRSGAIRWLLEEMAIPYELAVLDRTKGEHKAPAYLAINPHGKVPSLVHDGTILTETAAIACHLADAFPETGLAPKIGDEDRGPYLAWLFYGPSCVEAALLDAKFPRDPAPAESALGYGSMDAVVGKLVAALERGPWLLGARFSAADVTMGSTLRWGLMWQAIPAHPALTAYVKRLGERPASKKAHADDKALAERLKG